AALFGRPLEEKKDGRLAALARPFADAVAEPSATPGGGSVSALAVALAASLGQMVAGLSRKKKAQAPHVGPLSEHLELLRRDAAELLEAVDADAASYDRVMAAFKLPQGDAAETARREEALESSSKGAADVPMRVAERAVALFERLGQLDTIAAASMKSDLKVARLLAEAGARGAIANVEINLDGIKDAPYLAAKRQAITALRNKLSAAAAA